MKITVLGGSGFIGSHVADELSGRGHKVTIFDKKKSKWRASNQRMRPRDYCHIRKGSEVYKRK